MAERNPAERISRAVTRYLRYWDPNRDKIPNWVSLGALLYQLTLTRHWEPYVKNVLSNSINRDGEHRFQMCVGGNETFVKLTHQQSRRDRHRFPSRHSGQTRLRRRTPSRSRARTRSPHAPAESARRIPPWSLWRAAGQEAVLDRADRIEASGALIDSGQGKDTVQPTSDEEIEGELEREPRSCRQKKSRSGVKSTSAKHLQRDAIGSRTASPATGTDKAASAIVMSNFITNAPALVICKCGIEMLHYTADVYDQGVYKVKHLHSCTRCGMQVCC